MQKRARLETDSVKVWHFFFNQSVLFFPTSVLVLTSPAVEDVWVELVVQIGFVEAAERLELRLGLTAQAQLHQQSDAREPHLKPQHGSLRSSHFGQ